MATLRYNGPMDVRPLWGLDFPRGELVQVDDPALVKKALCLDHFELVESGKPAKQKAEAGEIVVPENWREIHHSTRMKLARQISGLDEVPNDDAAVVIIETFLAAK